MNSFYLMLGIMLAFWLGMHFWGANLRKQEEKIEHDKTVAKKEIDEKCRKAEIQLQKVKDENLNEISLMRTALTKIIRETKQQHPELATQIADAQYYLDMQSYNALLSKKRPAAKAADEVKKIASEKRELVKENKQLQYQLNFYETLFPWLEDFKEVPSDEAIAYVSDVYGSEYDSVKKWLSPEEYQKLSNSEKFQLALDRWTSRRKTDWDVGIEYERYIGYKLEMEGYKVTYTGATMGLKDMGRDLIASKNGKTLVIQCKRWAKEKTIHEKHILQLYGSVAVLATEHPEKTYKAVFITSTSLSDVARKCADYCGITIVENCPMGKYPLIKCNQNHDGTKIYHLPFDQQYDKVVISKNRQSCYAWTVEEAESLGFRHAYRWKPKSNQ